MNIERFAELDSYLNMEMQQAWKTNHQTQPINLPKTFVFWNMFAICLDEKFFNGLVTLVTVVRQVTNFQTKLVGF